MTVTVREHKWWPSPVQDAQVIQISPSAQTAAKSEGRKYCTVEVTAPTRSNTTHRQDKVLTWHQCRRLPCCRWRIWRWCWRWMLDTEWTSCETGPAQTKWCPKVMSRPVGSQMASGHDATGNGWLWHIRKAKIPYRLLISSKKLNIVALCICTTLTSQNIQSISQTAFQKSDKQLL